MTKLQTLKGHTFDLLHPTAAMIDPEEICVVLSRIPRFGGHTLDGSYFVAQHSLLVESLVVEPELKLPALLHDAHEVYSGFGDVQSPAKMIDNIVACELTRLHVRIDKVIAERFGFDWQLFVSSGVICADMIARSTERRDVMADTDDPSIWPEMPEPAEKRIGLMSSREAEAAFRERLYELWGGK